MTKIKQFSLNEILQIFEPSIGLEVHVTLDTKTKLFSATKVVDFKTKPNIAVGHWELGYPGIKPLLNKQAVVKSLHACYLLNMEVDDLVIFDRKNYYYPDLPKGYQLTQYYHPIGRNGYIFIFKNNNLVKVQLKRLHIEEDSAKMLHVDDKTLVDFNRASNPLIEIVTEHTDLRSGEDVEIFLTTLHHYLVDHNITKGRLEGGEFRFDVNVSLRKKNSLVLGTKVEIKNVSSFNFAKKATINEIIEIGNKLLNNMPVEEETKGFNNKTLKNFLMRKKTSLADYRYIPDCNIIPTKLNNDWINHQIKKISKKLNFSEKIHLVINTWHFPVPDAYSVVNNSFLFNFLDQLKPEERKKYYIFYSNLFLSYFKNNKKYFEKFFEINKFTYYLFQWRDKLEFNIFKSVIKVFFDQFPNSLNYNYNIFLDKFIKEAQIHKNYESEICQFIKNLIKKNQEIAKEYFNLDKQTKIINFFMCRLVPVFIKKVSNPKQLKKYLIQVLQNQEK